MRCTHDAPTHEATRPPNARYTAHESPRAHEERTSCEQTSSTMAFASLACLLACASRPNPIAPRAIPVRPLTFASSTLSVRACRVRLCASNPDKPVRDGASSLGIRGLAGRAVAVSSTFMVIWALILPGSAYTGIAAHDTLVQDMYERLGFTALAPTSLLTKYSALGQLPALTHALPGAVWSALAPLQLRGTGDAAHRALGRVMLAAASVLMIGYAIIDSNGLTADVADFAGHGGALADAVDAALPELPLPFNAGGLKLLASWFVLTGVLTASTARAGDTLAHRTWAVRHVAAGLWVAAQRPLFGLVRVVQWNILGSAAETSAAQADAFYVCAYLTIGLYILAAEVIAGLSAATPKERGP